MNTLEAWLLARHDEAAYGPAAVTTAAACDWLKEGGREAEAGALAEVEARGWRPDYASSYASSSSSPGHTWDWWHKEDGPGDSYRLPGALFRRLRGGACQLPGQSYYREYPTRLAAELALLDALTRQTADATGGVT